MAPRKALTGLLLAAGSVAGSLALRRRGARRRERVDLYFDDGSMISLRDRSPDAAHLLSLARQALGATGPR